VPGQERSAILTRVFPRFLPSSIPVKASGAWSRPFPDRTANILEVDVDAIGRSITKPAAQIVVAVVECHIKTELVQVLNVPLAAGDTDGPTSHDLGDLPTVAPTGPVVATTAKVSPALDFAICCRPE
jgi:hypothetical protein